MSKLKTLGFIAAMIGAFIMTKTPTFAQDISSGANNFYKSNAVTVNKVTFKNQYNMNVVGNLFTPKDLKQNTKNPAIIVGHPMGAVKEQSANLYATKMAERGFVTLSLDLSFWGESDGQPRNAVSPDIYAEDFSAALDFLGTQAFVDRNRIGVLGICGSGSFVISAAKIDPRMKAIATVSMYDMGAANRNGLRHSLTLDQRKKSQKKQRSNAMLSSLVVKPNTPAEPCISLLKTLLPLSVSFMTSTVRREVNLRLKAHRQNRQRIQH
jgi:fermentation-respiration switch protein FrsA (DUF1100 family)